MTFEEKVNALNFYAKAWYSTAQANAIYAAIFRQQGFGKFADLWDKEAEEEFKEAKKCTERVVQLGGTPEYGYTEQPMYCDMKELLEGWLKTGKEGVKNLNELAASCTDDVVTRKLFEEFAEDEADHMKWVCKHLAIIEKIGYDNYMIEMMDL